MNIWKWVVLLLGAILSYFIYFWPIEQAGFIFLYFEHAPDLRYMAIAFYVILGNAFSAILIIPIFAIVIQNRENLVAGLLALLPFLNNLSAYIQHNIIKSNNDILFVAVTGLTVLLIPVFYMYSYRLVSLAIKLLTSGSCRTGFCFTCPKR